MANSDSRHDLSAVIADDEWPVIGKRLGFSNGRQLSIIQMLLEGQKIDAIAMRLDLSPNTVQTYVQRIYRRLEIHSRLELMIRVLIAQRNCMPIDEFIAITRANGRQTKARP
jgi:DNA-binding NarL/FixJ family response regulator